LPWEWKRNWDSSDDFVLTFQKRLTDHRNGMRIRRAVVIVGEQAALTGAHTKQREVVRVDFGTQLPLTSAVAAAGE
jgi:hypothetical protein